LTCTADLGKERLTKSSSSGLFAILPPFCFDLGGGVVGYRGFHSSFHIVLEEQIIDVIVLVW
jgi:hypothetical protein